MAWNRKRAHRRRWARASAPTWRSGATSSSARAFARIDARALATDKWPAGSCVAPAPSICFRARGADDLGPFLGLGRQERPEVLAEGRARFRTKLADARDHVRRLERFGDFVAQFHEHRLRRLRRSNEAVPGGGTETHKPLLGDRGHIGSC